MPVSHRGRCRFSFPRHGAQLWREVAGVEGSWGGWRLRLLLSRSFAWRSPCRRAVGAWWVARWTAGSRRGRPGRSAPTRVAPAVSPHLPPCPPLPTSATRRGGDPQPRVGSGRPRAGVRSAGSAPSHAEAFGGDLGCCRDPEVLGFLNKAGCFQSTRQWKTQLRKQVDRCLEDYFGN